MSKSPRGGLGRGIESLIRTSAPAPVSKPAAPATPEATATSTTPLSTASPANPSPANLSPSSNAGVGETESTPRVRPAGGVSSPLEVFWGSNQPETPGDTPLRPEFRDLPVDAIQANTKQPRTVFDDDSLAELAYSISEFGVLQPIVVRPVAGNEGSNGSNGNAYELVMGERRLRAARVAGLSTIPAVIRHTADEAMLRDALLENIHRAQLNPLEEAAAYQQLLGEFGVTHDELAARIGRSRSQVTNTVRLMNLSLPVQRRVAAGVLSAGHARALLALADPETQDDLAARIVAEGLSVRATEELVSLTAKGLMDAPRKRQRRHFAAPAATDLAERLSDRFDTTVRVDIGRRKGKVTIEFATVDDLERIVAVMAPDLVAERPAVAAPPPLDAVDGGAPELD